MQEKIQLDSLKIVEVFAFKYVEMFQKWKLRNIEWKTPIIMYLNGVEIYICSDKWLHISDRDLKTSEVHKLDYVY